MRVPFVLKRDLREGIVSVSETLLYVPNGRRILSSLLALAALFGLLVFKCLKTLHVTHSGEVQNFKCGGQIIVFLLVLFAFSILTVFELEKGLLISLDILCLLLAFLLLGDNADTFLCHLVGLSLDRLLCLAFRVLLLLGNSRASKNITLALTNLEKTAAIVEEDFGIFGCCLAIDLSLKNAGSGEHLSSLFVVPVGVQGGALCGQVGKSDFLRVGVLVVRDKVIGIRGVNVGSTNSGGYGGRL
ncbi:hypothetical protein HG530_013365 [Fusarium avenaceum]|nr:hypothetical protein HG530_013365 [Fusarium avenaceum]